MPKVHASKACSCTQGGGRGDSLEFPELQVMQRLCVMGSMLTLTGLILKAAIRTLQLYVWRLPEEPCVQSLRPFALELGRLRLAETEPQVSICSKNGETQHRAECKSLNLDDYSCLPVSHADEIVWSLALPALRECEHRNRIYQPERKFIKATVQLIGKIFFETVGAQQEWEPGCLHVFLISGSC